MLGRGGPIVSKQPAPLHLTQEQFEAMHEALERTRSSAKVVRVDREALRAILMDHATMTKETGR